MLRLPESETIDSDRSVGYAGNLRLWERAQPHNALLRTVGGWLESTRWL